MARDDPGRDVGTRLSGVSAHVAQAADAGLIELRRRREPELSRRERFTLTAHSNATPDEPFRLTIAARTRAD